MAEEHQQATMLASVAASWSMDSKSLEEMPSHASAEEAFAKKTMPEPEAELAAVEAKLAAVEAKLAAVEAKLAAAKAKLAANHPRMQGPRGVH